MLSAPDIRKVCAPKPKGQKGLAQGFNPISANLRKSYNERVYPVPEGPNESSLARSAWKQEKSEPVPEGRLICSLVPEIFFVELYVVRF